MSQALLLISHALCPYVQRVAIVLREKGLSFQRQDIDLSHKPDWFLRLSPLGKTPVLLVEGQPIFESAAICEYLDDTALPRLHPTQALQRAQHRAWIELGSSLLNTIGAFYTAGDEATLAARAADIRARLAQLDAALGDGPFFAGPSFSLVDAAFGPAFRYFDVIDTIDDFGFWAGLPRLTQWRRNLARRPSVAAAAHQEYPQLLRQFLSARRSALSRRMDRGHASD
ncbi:glutathione S-transferase family protein [Kinneretia aquatilis]|uniref:glutathione S-transferase family protein n=1 Tax=Kinneretia aquatilis TaxID=2070761 RepID=UPI0014951A3B|nr:glutathione S-transferase family protein [Paucibacter aquatile]WIW00279.1 glutathione S-transferase family protein [Paucibacter aquatile]